jgi:membrane protease YdiL (CAAX protease family)
MKTTTMNWIRPLSLLLLLGAGNALVEPHRRTLTDSARKGLHMHMSLPSIRGFRLPVASQKSKATKELWYRDRSAAEEQMTTQLAPNLSTTSTSTSRPTTPAMKTEDWNPFGAVNLPMVQATCLSHATLLMVGSTVLSLALLLNPASNALDWSSLHWNGDAAAPFHSLMDWSMTPLRVSEGVLATIPLVTLSSMMCNSEELMCPIHFSLTNTVLSLFGRREDVKGTNPLTVLLFSLGIGSVSALSEELVFRGLLPTALVAYTHSVELALVGQALLFGIGQIRRKSSMAENGVFSLMQSMNGLWYGMVYLGTGGDILPVLVAHVLYECHIFVGGWKMINDQLDYTEQTLNQVSPSEQLQLDTIQKEAGGSLKPEILDHCRKFFYAFDYDHRGSLSRADVKRAVVYAFLQDDPVNKPSDAKTSAVFDEIIQKRPAGSQEEDEEDRIGLSEFLHLLFALKSKTWSNHQLA